MAGNQLFQSVQCSQAKNEKKINAKVTDTDKDRDTWPYM